MKLLIAKSFDKALTAGKKAAQELDQFIDYVNTFTDNVTRILQKGINITDNIDGEFRDVKMISGIELSLKLTKEPQAILVARSQLPLASLTWTTRDKLTRVTATFTGGSTSEVKLLILN
jgi:hypothetical protein